MEKHLDDLATTVHKLLPATGDERPLIPAQPTILQHRMPDTTRSSAVTATAVPARPVSTPATSPASASNSKAIWIGIAAVVVLAAVIVGVMLGRGGASSPGPAQTPAATNPPAAENVTPDPTPAPKPVSPVRKASSPSPAANSGVDPIVGCYQWFNNSPVEIRADGTVTGGPFTGHWRLVNAEQRAYTFTWPVMVETLTVSPDQRSMSGGNQYGYPISGGRVSGTVGLPGTWHWANGWMVNVASNGTFTSGSFRGTWRAVDASRGLYEMNWPSPVDNVVLLAGGTRISGANQYGVSTGGVKTGACGGN